MIITGINELKLKIKELKKKNKTIGFVPTMGYLHKGHISLVEASKKENDITIISIFVNPVQFGPGEDYSSYPRDIRKDSELAFEAGVDFIFAPDVVHMYPNGYNTYIDVHEVTDVLCGKSRPGHFRGVATVVAKLFNIVEPDRAYFGQKDAQQVVVIKRMVQDLNMNVNIITCPIVREQDGLAMSSRNTYLSPDERKAATIISKSLFSANALIEKGERSTKTITDFIKGEIKKEKLAIIDYVEIYDAENLKSVDTIDCKALIAAAVKIGNTRLIDNIIVEVK
ncbi:MAG TPA: pantoate--beta-alanine ligase [Clostridia bacterium]